MLLAADVLANLGERMKQDVVRGERKQKPNASLLVGKSLASRNQCRSYLLKVTNCDVDSNSTGNPHNNLTRFGYLVCQSGWYLYVY